MQLGDEGRHGRTATYGYGCAFQSEDVQTEPPPRANFTDTVNQWIIYDAYTVYERNKEMQEEMDKGKGKKEEAAAANTFRYMSGHSLEWFIEEYAGNAKPRSIHHVRD